MNEITLAARFHAEKAFQEIAATAAGSIGAAGTAYSTLHAQKFLKEDLPFLLDNNDTDAVAEGVMQALITQRNDIPGLPDAQGIRTLQRNGQETDITLAYEVLKVIAGRQLRALTPERFSIYVKAQLAQLPNHSGRIGDIVALNPALAGTAAEMVVAELEKTKRNSNAFDPLRTLLTRIATADAGMTTASSIQAATVRKAAKVLGSDVIPVILSVNPRLDIDVPIDLLPNRGKASSYSPTPALGKATAG